ncbi:hypothetical protein BD779DRAFT_1480603 [Infundibulicybe gibba]|nr:hypothetical protein BD779DRAFT_1480603 [Infundibulicybe gibba]
MVTELDLYGIDGDSLQLLTIRSDSPHGILFPRLERLVVRYHPFVYFDPEQVSYRSDMFHSRLYLAPNTTIIENVSPLRHAELHLVSLVDCGLLDFDELDRLDKWHDLQKLIRSLRSVYLGQPVIAKKVRKRGEGDPGHEYACLPSTNELGYCAGRLPTGETIRFYRKLDIAFRALEEYHITHPLEILVCIVFVANA